MWISSGRDPVVEQHEGKTLLQQRWTAEVARALLVDGVSAVVVDEEVFAVRGTPEIGPWPGLSHGVLRSEEHTSELQSLMRISYAVFCLKKKHILSIHNQLN